MVAQYGVAVLGKPPASGFNLLVYILPPALLLGGAVLLILHAAEVARRARERRGAACRGRAPLGPRRAQAARRELASASMP